MSGTAAVAGGFSVVIEDLQVTAVTFARLQDDAAGSTGAASGALSGTTGMAGDDAVLVRWRERYDPMAAALWGAVSTAGTTLGSIAERLVDTGNEYLAGDQASTVGMTGAPERLPDVGVRGGTAPAPPPSTGPNVIAVPPDLAAYFPGGDPERLRVSGAAWSELAVRLEDVGFAGDGAFRSLIGANSGATFSAMETFWARHFVSCDSEPLFNAVSLGARQLGRSCAELADLIDRIRAAVLGVAAEAAADMSPWDLPARLLGRFTWGVTELELLVATGMLTLDYLQNYSDEYLRQLQRLVDQLSPEDRARLERLSVPPAPTEPVGVGLADVSEVVGLGLRGSAWNHITAPHPTPDSIQVTDAKRTHILDGDGSDKGGRDMTKVAIM